MQISTKKRTKRKSILTILTAILLLTLTACGGADSVSSNGKTNGITSGMTTSKEVTRDDESGLTESSVKAPVVDINPAITAEEASAGDFKYEYDNELGGIIITRYIGDKEVVNIPEGVTTIGEGVFSYTDNLSSINIPEGVASIGALAFIGCESLTSINLPDSVVSLGDRAFEWCESLKSITIPTGCTIERGFQEVIDCFSYCTSLVEINVDSNNVNCTSDNGVLYNKDMTELICCPAGKYGDFTIPNGVVSLGKLAFFYCDKVTGITFPESMTTLLGDHSFEGCTSLAEINVDGNNENFTSDNGVLYNKDMTKLVCCPGGRNGDFVIPNSITSIGVYAFSCCAGLTSIEIPDSVTEIGYRAFSDCTGLTSIAIPNNVTTIYNYMFFGCTGLVSIEIPNSVTRIGIGAFEKCSALTSITIPDSVTKIGDYAFDDYTALTAVFLTSIED